MLTKILAGSHKMALHKFARSLSKYFTKFTDARHSQCLMVGGHVLLHVNDKYISPPPS